MSGSFSFFLLQCVLQCVAVCCSALQCVAVRAVMPLMSGSLSLSLSLSVPLSILCLSPTHSKKKGIRVFRA